MTRKVKSKSTAVPIASSLKSKEVSLPQLSTINAAVLSVLHLYCVLLFSICRNVWHHLEGKSSPFADASALANFAFPAMKTPLVSLDEFCGRFWFPQTFMHLLMLALQLLKRLDSHFSITIPNDLYSAFPSKSRFHFWKHTLGLKPLNPSENFPSNEEILAKYDPDRNVPDINDDIEISDHEDSNSSDEDGSGDEDIVEVKPSKRPICYIKPPIRATPIIEVPACSSGSSKTKQKSRPAASSSTQVTIKTEPSSLKCKARDTSLPQPPARKRACTVIKTADKSSDPKGKRRAVDPPPDEGKKDIMLRIWIAAKSIQDLNLEDIVGGVGQGRPAKENASNVLRLLQALGRTKAMEVLRSHPGLLNLGLSNTFWPIHKIMSALTTHPGADADINNELSCTQCDSANACCETGSGTSTRCQQCTHLQLQCSFGMYFFDAFTMNNQHFVQSLSSLTGLAFQMSAIFDLMVSSFCIRQQISLLHVQEESHDPNFTPSEEQLNILCTSLGWIARDLGVPDGYEFEVICPMDLFFASFSDIWVILKGTDFDVTGLKSSSYMIIDNKVVMVDGSEAPHFEGLTTANAGPSSATLHAASPTNTVDSTNEASAMAADNAKSSLVDVPQPMSLLTLSSASDSIMFFSLLCLLTAPKSIDEDEDEVLYTLLT
uniref:Uncharacterized protein n=1 Tax=Moniliophthora roreri TaxID=221103 RepID=A0A0W0FBT9_MONRR